ncbi:MAG: hypothetical protein AB1757_06025 [Acidobacteriota bacterium]
MYRVMILFIGLAILPACSLKPRQAPNDDVDKAAILFFQRLESEQYDKIYNDAAESYKKTYAKSDAIEAFKQIAAMGKTTQPNRVEMRLETEDGKRVAFPKFAIQYGQVPGSIIFKFVDEGGEWKLGGFDVRQKGLS